MAVIYQNRCFSFQKSLVAVWPKIPLGHDIFYHVPGHGFEPVESNFRDVVLYKMTYLFTCIARHCSFLSTNSYASVKSCCPVMLHLLCQSMHSNWINRRGLMLQTWLLSFFITKQQR